MPTEAEEEAREYARKQARVVAKAWLDPAFKNRLLANPAEVLKEYGIVAPEGCEVKVLEHSDNVRYFHLPPKPASLEQEFSDEQLTLAGAEMILFTCSRQCTFESHWV